MVSPGNQVRKETRYDYEVCMLWAGNGDEGAFRLLWCTIRTKMASIRKRRLKQTRQTRASRSKRTRKGKMRRRWCKRAPTCKHAPTSFVDGDDALYSLWRNKQGKVSTGKRWSRRRWCARQWRQKLTPMVEIDGRASADRVEEDGCEVKSFSA